MDWLHSRWDSIAEDLDAESDDYNRLLAYHLFITYNLSLKNDKQRAANDLHLQKICKEKLPRYLYDKIVEAGAKTKE